MHFVRAVLLKAFICLANLAMFLLELGILQRWINASPSVGRKSPHSQGWKPGRSFRDSEL